MIDCMVACSEHRFRTLTERSSFALSYASQKESRQESSSQGRSKEARSSEKEGRQKVIEKALVALSRIFSKPTWLENIFLYL